MYRTPARTRQNYTLQRNRGRYAGIGRALIAIVGLATCFALGIESVAPQIEADVEDAVAKRLSQFGIEPLEVTATGQAVTVVAMTSVDRRRFIRAVANSAKCDTWIGQVKCASSTSVTLASPSDEYERHQEQPTAKDGDWLAADRHRLASQRRNPGIPESTQTEPSSIEHWQAGGH